jgi:hypothetical protein
LCNLNDQVFGLHRNFAAFSYEALPTYRGGAELQTGKIDPDKTRFGVSRHPCLRPFPRLVNIADKRSIIEGSRAVKQLFLRVE